MTKEMISDYTLKITQSSRSSLIVVMYDLAIEYLNEAISAKENDDHALYRENALNAVKVVSDLMGSLDFNYELAKPLYRVYEYIQGQITGAVIKDDSEPIKRVKKYLTMLKASFEKVAMEDSSGPLMGNAQSVYAGLTYGKGALVENVTAERDNRGYTV